MRGDFGALLKWLYQNTRGLEEGDIIAISDCDYGSAKKLYRLMVIS